MTAREKLNTFTPEFEVEISGSPLPKKAIADLISITVLEDVDAMSMVTIVLPAWDADKVMAKWIDEELFREGNPVQIKMGYRNQKYPVFSGEITGLEPDFPEARPPMLTVRGYDRRHRLMRHRKTKSFTNVKDSDIATKLAREAGLQAQTEDSRVMLPYVLQHNQTDFDFLLGRANRIDYEVLVDDRTLLFRPRKIDKSATLTLQRDINLLEFRPRMTTMGQVQEFTLHGWNPKDKKEIIAVANSEPTLMGGSVSGPANVKHLFQNTGATRVTMPVQNQDEADSIVKQRFSEMALGYIRGEGLSIGNPELRAGNVIKIEGIGKRFSGLYYVCSTEHRFSLRKGYRTAFSVRRTAT